MKAASVLRLLTALMLGAVALASPLLAHQDGDRVMAAVRGAMAPALPFPATSEDGTVPANGNTEALWMVRPLQPGDRAIEVIANPLNEANQLKAERAMAQIERNIQAAQRRDAAQYDRAVAEAKRTGRTRARPARGSMPSRTSPSTWRSTDSNSRRRSRPQRHPPLRHWCRFPARWRC